MLKFIKAVSAVVVGNFIAWTIGGVVALLAMLALIGALSQTGADSHSRRHAVPNKAVLVYDLGINISDMPTQSAPGEILSKALGGRDEDAMGLLDLVHALDAATKDPRIETLLLRGTVSPRGYGTGLPALTEVRRAIARFRASGKRVVAHLDSPSMRDYYIASASDTLAIHPFSELAINGMATNAVYFGAAFKKYGVGVQTTKVGTYKSAIEPFTADRMSPADKKQTRELLESLWRSTTDEIAAARHIAPETLRKLGDEHGIIAADDAVNLKLVDKTAYLDEIIDDLKKAGAEDDDTGSFAQVNLRDYVRGRPKPAHPAENDDDKVVVLYAEGEIVDADGYTRDMFGGEWLAAELRQLNRNGSVKALVLRVNSPGGSAFASEVARREIQKFRESGRPVVVSMGSLAASGGYWISADANRIFAEKTTITGSIGVFGLMFNVKDLAGSIGVNFDGVKTSRYADIESISRPKTDDELALLQKFTDDIYGKFIALVAEGRHLAVERVEEIAQGRVWSGDDAVKLGLVDEIGGLTDAITYARKSAKIGPSATVCQVPAQTDPARALAALFSGDDRQNPVAGVRSPAGRVLRTAEDGLRRLSTFNDRRHVYARIPYILEVE